MEIDRNRTCENCSKKIPACQKYCYDCGLKLGYDEINKKCKEEK